MPRSYSARRANTRRRAQLNPRAQPTSGLGRSRLPTGTRVGWFYLDDTDPIRGRTDGTTWNGWANPWFKAATLVRWLRKNGFQVKVAKRKISIAYGDWADDQDYPVTADGYVYMGGGWTWNEED